MTTMRSRARQGLLSVVDQVISSGTNAVLLISVASSSSASDFGYFSVMYATFAFFLSFIRHFFGVHVSLAGSVVNVRQQAGAALTLTSLSATVVFPAVLIVPLIAGGELQPGWIAFAVGACAAAVQDIGRHSLVALRKPLAAIASDLVWLVAAVIGFFFTRSGNESAIFISWSLGAVAAAALTLSSGGQATSFRHAWTVTVSSWRDRARLAVGSSANAFSVAAASAIMARLAGPEISGALAATSQLMAPVSIGSSAVTFAVLPISSSLTNRSSYRLFSFLAVGLFLLSIIWVVVLTLVPDGAGVYLLGDTWSTTSGLLWILGPSYSISVVGASGSALLMRFRLASAISRLRAAQATIRIAITTTLAATFSAPQALAVGELITNAIFSAAIWRRIGLYMRSIATPTKDVGSE